MPKRAQHTDLSSCPNQTIVRLKADIKELSDRLIERTAAYEAKDAKQVRKISSMQAALRIIASDGEGQFQWSPTKACALAGKALAESEAV